MASIAGLLTVVLQWMEQDVRESADGGIKSAVQALAQQVAAAEAGRQRQAVEAKATRRFEQWARKHNHAEVVERLHSSDVAREAFERTLNERLSELRELIQEHQRAGDESRALASELARDQAAGYEALTEAILAVPWRMAATLKAEATFAKTKALQALLLPPRRQLGLVDPCVPT